MQWIFGKSAMWFFATMAAAAVAFAAGQGTSLPEGEGKQLVSEVCAACHSLESVTSQQLDKEGWKDVVTRMVASGASIDEKQVPIITEYLAKNFGPQVSDATAQVGGGLPDSEGKLILQNACTTCHDLDLVTGTQASKQGWQDIVNNMNAKGAGLSDKDTAVLVEYLATAFPEKK